jgi:cell wall-associated NlpC family hydrolase
MWTAKPASRRFELINSDKAKQSPTLAKEARRKANIDTMIATAKAHLGDKYILGNEGPNTFDCSGLVYYCLKEAGSNAGGSAPRVTAESATGRRSASAI